MKVVDETSDIECYVFRVGYEEVIKGLDKGMLGMCIGEKRRLTIPSEMGYGHWGSGEEIRPDDALIMEVELLDLLQRDWSAAYQKRVLSFEEDLRACNHFYVYQKRRPFIRGKRYRVTVPQEGLEIKAVAAKRKIKALPYRNWWTGLDNDAKDRRKRKWKKREKAWQAERSRTRANIIRATREEKAKERAAEAAMAKWETDAESVNKAAAAAAAQRVAEEQAELYDEI